MMHRPRSQVIDRLLDGGIPATPDEALLAATLTTLRSELRQAPDPSVEARHLAAMAAARAGGAAEGRPPLVRRPTWPVWLGHWVNGLRDAGRRRAAVVWVSAVVLVLGLFTGAAEAGGLPGPVQNAVASFAKHLGIDLPTSGPAHRPTGSLPTSAGTTTTAAANGAAPVRPPATTTPTVFPSPRGTRPATPTTRPTTVTVPSPATSLPRSATTTTTGAAPSPPPPASTTSTTSTTTAVCDGVTFTSLTATLQGTSGQAVLVTATLSGALPSWATMSAGIGPYGSQDTEGAVSMTKQSPTLYQATYTSSTAVPVGTNVLVGTCDGNLLDTTSAQRS